MILHVFCDTFNQIIDFLKKLLSIFLASLILFFSAGFKIATHYCGEEAVDSSFSVLGNVESCGMDKEELSDCSTNQSRFQKKDCCSDEVLNLEIDNKFELKKNNFSKIELSFVSVFFHVAYFNLFGNENLKVFDDYAPPILANNILVTQQVFLI